MKQSNKARNTASKDMTEESAGFWVKQIIKIPNTSYVNYRKEDNYKRKVTLEEPGLYAFMKNDISITQETRMLLSKKHLDKGDTITLKEALSALKHLHKDFDAKSIPEEKEPIEQVNVNQDKSNKTHAMKNTTTQNPPSIQVEAQRLIKENLMAATRIYNESLLPLTFSPLIINSNKDIGAAITAIYPNNVCDMICYLYIFNIKGDIVTIKERIASEGGEEESLWRTGSLNMSPNGKIITITAHQNYVVIQQQLGENQAGDWIKSTLTSNNRQYQDPSLSQQPGYPPNYIPGFSQQTYPNPQDHPIYRNLYPQFKQDSTDQKQGNGSSTLQLDMKTNQTIEELQGFAHLSGWSEVYVDGDIHVFLIPSPVYGSPKLTVKVTLTK